jgi:integrase
MATPTPTFAAYVRRWLPRVRARTRPRTVYLYEFVLARYVEPTIGTRPLADVTRGDVLDLVAAMQRQGLAPATIKQTLTVLAMVLAEAVDEELVARNVARGLGRRVKAASVRPPTVYTPADVARFMLVAEAEHPALAPLFSLCSGAALRIGEARALRGEDLDLERRTVRVARSVGSGLHVGPTKGGRPRVIDLPASTLRLVAPLTRRAWCFPGRGGEGVVSYTTVRAAMHTICDAAQIARGAPHALRHAHASALAVAGVPLLYVQQRLGHADIKTTMIYAGHLAAPRPDVLDGM